MDVAADGMSQTYRLAVTLASALYGAIGLFLSYRLARCFAEPFVCFVTILVLWWGTPVAYYMYIAPGMSHAASLFAVAVFFSLGPWVQARPSRLRWAVWGASAGLMALVRLQDLFFAVAALVPAVAMDDRVKRCAAFGLAAFLVFPPSTCRVSDSERRAAAIVARAKQDGVVLAAFFSSSLLSRTRPLFLEPGPPAVQRRAGCCFYAASAKQGSHSFLVSCRKSGSPAPWIHGHKRGLLARVDSLERP